MIPELDPEDFVAFLSALWDERGWQTSVRERSDETYFVTGKRPDGKRGVIYAFPTTTATVTERHLKQFVQFCRTKGIDVAVVATQGAFAEGAERVAAERGVHLLDRSTLADTVAEGDLEEVLARFTGAGGMVGRLRDLGVPIPASIVSGVPSPAKLGAAVYGLLPVGGTDTHAGSGGSSPADDPAPSSPSPDGLGILAGARKYAARPVPAIAIAITLIVAFVLGATVGPAVGLGGAGPVSGGGDAGPEVSAVSTADAANATVDVRWNARATDSIAVNGTTYDAPEGKTFVLVRMNVTNGGDEPVQLEQSALAADVAGTRYGHQPLDGVTGFPSAGLFAPGDSREVWTVFAVPAEAGSVTVVLDSEAKVRFVRDDTVTPEATVDGG
ncbi:restriction endonuclease [Halobellus ruber]|uniref:Restriction endonuclease n=1 Tax=Halobellus ruber TaxID=2761102 RepID=A0A7J9SIB5_9EURY|nr:restriction endonuclease [Halobellus ruber]